MEPPPRPLAVSTTAQPLRKRARELDPHRPGSSVAHCQPSWPTTYYTKYVTVTGRWKLKAATRRAGGHWLESGVSQGALARSRTGNPAGLAALVSAHERQQHTARLSCSRRQRSCESPTVARTVTAEARPRRCLLRRVRAWLAGEPATQRAHSAFAPVLPPLRRARLSSRFTRPWAPTQLCLGTLPAAKCLERAASQPAVLQAVRAQPGSHHMNLKR